MSEIKMAEQYKYWYKLDHWDVCYDLHAYTSSWPVEEGANLAEEAAYDYWFQCHGEEDDWPQIFQIYDEYRNLIGSYLISVAFPFVSKEIVKDEPIFTADGVL